MSRSDDVLEALAATKRQEDDALRRFIEETAAIERERNDLLLEARALKIPQRDVAHAVGASVSNVGRDMRELERQADTSIERGARLLLDQDDSEEP